MPQPGSTTIISASTRLILLDCFETLVELAGGRYRPRQGVPAFLVHFHRLGLPLVVISDALQAVVEDAVASAGLRPVLTAVYHAGDAAEPLPDGRTRKRLDLPLRDFAVPTAQAVFIGDSPMDAEAAAHHGVPFIRVPRSEDRAFSFATLIGGPSRYDSDRFALTFLDAHRRRVDPS